MIDLRYAEEGQDAQGKHLAALLAEGLASLVPCQASAAAASTAVFGREEEMAHGRKGDRRKGAGALCVCPAEGVQAAWEALGHEDLSTGWASSGGSGGQGTPFPAVASAAEAAASSTTDAVASGGRPGDCHSSGGGTLTESFLGQSADLPGPLPLTDIKGRLAAWHRLAQVECDLAAAVAIKATGSQARAQLEGTLRAVHGQMEGLDESGRRTVTLELDRVGREQDMEDTVMASRVYELKRLTRELRRKLGGGWE
jgi:hypothetical protein